MRRSRSCIAIMRNYLILLVFWGLLEDAIQVPTAAVDDESPVCRRNFGT
jgi:hypothetical protein